MQLSHIPTTHDNIKYKEHLFSVLFNETWLEAVNVDYSEETEQNKKINP